VDAPPADGSGSEDVNGWASVSRCVGCENELVEIALTIDGARLMMRSCSTCDTRSWHRDGEAVELGGVLHDISAVPTRYRRSLAG
jgi:hypothetical protein